MKIRCTHLLVLTATTFLLSGLLPVWGQGSSAHTKPTPPTIVDPAQPRPEAEQVQLSKDLLWFKSVETDAPLRGGTLSATSAKYEAEAKEELRAYDYTVSFASKQDPALLRKHSLKGVAYQDLFDKKVHHDYLRDLIHFEGTLRMLKPMKATDDLIALDGIDTLYQAWILPKGAREVVFLCLVVTKLPEGIEPGEDLYREVAFDAYFFKLFHYESREEKKEGKTGWHKAPLFLGQTFEDKGVTKSVAEPYSSATLIGFVVGLVILLGTVITLGLVFRRGDRGVKEAQARRLAELNAFEAPTAETVLTAHGPEVFGFLTVMLRDPIAAREVYAQFAEDIWRGLPGFRAESSVRTWVYVVARHAALRFQRTRGQAWAIPLDDSSEADRVAFRQTVSRHGTTTRELLARIRAALSPDDQALLTLRIDRELEWNEVARVFLADQPDPGADVVARKTAALRKRFERLKTEIRLAMTEAANGG